MNNIFGIENHFKLINTIVSSTNELVKMLKESKELELKLSETIQKIMVFIEKVFDVMPDILVSREESNELKKEVLDQYARVAASWEMYKDYPELFFEAWDNFLKTWHDFHNLIVQKDKTNRTIFLSMN